jgi:hypothetical protein
MLEWCLGPVVAKADRRGNLDATKQRPDRKIDVVALMIAIGRAMTGRIPTLASMVSSPSRYSHKALDPCRPGSPKRAAVTCTAASERDGVHLYPI